MKHDTLHPGLALAPTSSEQSLVKTLASDVQAGDAYVPTINLLCELFVTIHNFSRPRRFLGFLPAPASSIRKLVFSLVRAGSVSDSRGCQWPS